MLCVPRQIAELLKLPLQEVMEDFNSICPGNWQQRGVSPAEIRTFSVWRNAPMFYVDCRGRLLDCFQPAEKEERAIAFTSWNGHAFFYRSARAVAACDESEQRQRFRRVKRDNPLPDFKEWQLWEGEIKSGYFYTEDIRGVRAQLLAEGHQPKVSMRGLCEWSARRLRVQGGTDCVIRELCEDAQVLQQWTERLGVPYRGQRLAGASLDVFLHLLQGKREDTRSRREELLARQQGMCKLCGAPITLGTFEIDHVIPVAQSFSGQQQELQALCLECHRTKTSLEGHSGEPLLSLCVPELRRHPQAAAAGLPAAEVGSRPALPGHRRVPLPQERPRQRSLPAAGVLPPGLHRAHGGGTAGGPHVGGDALRPPQGCAGSAALRG